MPTTATTTGEQPFHITFGKVDANMGGLVPIAAPEWLEECLDSPTDKRLNNRSILINWGSESEPDWLVGKLGAKGNYTLEFIKGNFKAKYASNGNTAVHLLRFDGYAESVEGEPELAWVLLGETPPSAPPAAPSAVPPLPLPAPAPTPAQAPLSAAGAMSAARTANGKQRATPSPVGPSSMSSATATGRRPLSAGAGSSRADSRRNPTAAEPPAEPPVARVAYAVAVYALCMPTGEQRSRQCQALSR